MNSRMILDSPSLPTLEYRINVQQILFKFWVFRKKRGAEFVLYYLFTTYTLIWSTPLFGTLEYSGISELNEYLI